LKRIAAILGVCLLLTACRTANVPPTTQQAPPNQTQTQRVQQTVPQPAYDQSPQATADRLVQIASRVKKVQKATAVVLGKYAVVGITVDPKLDRSEVGVTKYSVAEALKHDPQGAKAVVTADPAIVQRLREMSDDIRNGHPVAGIAQELGDMVGRMMPQLPRDVELRERPSSPQNPEKVRQGRP
jgi:YhcN/YlaJ family sporulation lipoprotein